MNELTVTKERVLAAAKECSTAKRTLQLLFPQAFEEKKYDLYILVCTDFSINFSKNKRDLEGLDGKLSGINLSHAGSLGCGTML